jgi:hypothetical protein
MNSAGALRMSKRWMAFTALLALLAAPGCRSTSWQDPFEQAITAQCGQIFTCSAGSPHASVETWFGRSGTSLDECLANGNAWIDEREQEQSSILQWGGCTESEGTACLDAIEAQSCEQVLTDPGGPSSCARACDFNMAG